MTYKVNRNFSIEVGFKVDHEMIERSATLTNEILADLPSTLYKSIDYKTTSAMIGAVFCDTLASISDGIVNPIEKGHPDIIPISGQDATEKELRKYHAGLEIKCTVGNVTQGSNLRAGQSRIDELVGITWQAHHREVEALMGLVWDFYENDEKFNFPRTTGIFYSDNLKPDDWGAISGTSGRNTKVTGMKSSGKSKMGNGWVLLPNNEDYLKRYGKLLKINSV